MVFADPVSILRPGDKLGFEITRRDSSLVVTLTTAVPNADLNEKDERKRKLTVLLARPFTADLSIENPDEDFRRQYVAYASVYSQGRDALDRLCEEMSAAVTESREPRAAAKKDSRATAVVKGAEGKKAATSAAKPALPASAAPEPHDRDHDSGEHAASSGSASAPDTSPSVTAPETGSIFGD